MRIVAGVAGGRRLKGPEGRATRPMTDRAREGLFSSILADVPGSRVLDLFAGSGALGLEALSRGARSAVFVERDRAALVALTTNVEAIGLGGEVVGADVTRHLEGAPPHDLFDLAFVDPPYDASLPSVVEVLDRLVPWLSPGALVVLHRRVGEERPHVDGLVPEAARAYGTAQLWRYRRTMGDTTGARQPDEDRGDHRSEESR